jgi:broad specificity phosphatase PhoE
MDIIFIRHGNTFGPGDRIVWVGGSLDLPLVAQGERQARFCGQAIERGGLRVCAIYAGPLLRTQATARLVAEELAAAPIVRTHAALNEIDYGEWTGKTDEEVKAAFGADELAAWSLHSEWPKRGGWRGSADQTAARAREFVAELVTTHAATDLVVVVSSNGLLRYFLTLIPGLFEHRCAGRAVKMRTGHFGWMVCHDSFELKCWDLSPEDLVKLVGRAPA